MSSISKPSALDLLVLALVAIIWGSAFSAIKIIVGELGAMWAAALRVCIGFAVVAPLLFFRKNPPEIRLDHLRDIAIVALLNMVIPFILISWSMKHIQAGVGSLLLGLTPFVAMIIGHFATNDERITSRRAIAVAFALTGIIVLVGPGALTGLQSTALWAQLAVMMAGVCYVSAGFVMRRLDLDAVTFTAFALGAGSAMLCAIAGVSVGAPNLDLSQEVVLTLIWLGVLPTGVAYLLRYWLVRRVGVSTFALAMNTVPVFGIMIAAFYLGETVHWTTLVALGFVLTGLAIARSSAPGTAKP